MAMRRRLLAETSTGGRPVRDRSQDPPERLFFFHQVPAMYRPRGIVPVVDLAERILPVGNNRREIRSDVRFDER
jgi:broad specificity phosphatase PhoE